MKTDLHLYLRRALGMFSLASITLFFCATILHAAAFPGAEGYGAGATGGRGGRVIHVTNLHASGPGSLQAALSESGPRIIVFDVSGLIVADEIRIEHGDFTLAGETAPGAGITLDAKLWATYLDFSITNFIIRHIRVRPTDLSGDQGDAIRLANNSNFILDHVTTSWGSDETVDLFQSHDFTVQWSTIEASAPLAGHSDGALHNYGLLNGPSGGNATIHHNLFAHHSHRSPAVANGMSAIVNNLVYNFKRGFVHHNPADTTGFNFIGNYYKTGPDDTDPIAILLDDSDLESGPHYYMDDLCYNGRAVADPWDIVRHWPAEINPVPTQAAAPFPTPAITTHGCLESYDLVLARAGAWPRDAVTRQTIEEVSNGTGAWGRNVPADLMAGLTPAPAPADGDGDGMPDDWETARGLNPAAADDDGDDDGDGYTNIEEYLHYRSDLLIYGDSPPCNANGTCDAGENSTNCPADCPADPTDTLPPTVPGDLSAQAISDSQIDLSWSAATDNVGVEGYRIHRYGTAIATVNALSYSDTGLNADTSYAYSITAYDAAGNESDPSSPATALTLAGEDNGEGDSGGGGGGSFCFVTGLRR